MNELVELTLITRTAVADPPPTDDAEVQLFTLDDQEASQEFWQAAARMLDGHQSLLVIPVDADASGLLTEIRELLAAERRDFEELFEEMLRRRRPLRDRRLLEAKRLAEAKQTLLERYGALTSADLAAASSRAKNPSQTAYRWAKSGKIFSVPFQGKDFFPGFQFDENTRPLPVISDILQVLEDNELKPWEVAFWFTSATGWLDDRAPVEVLEAEPENVVNAARSTFEAATF